MLAFSLIEMNARVPEFWKGEGKNYKRIYAGYTPTANDGSHTIEIGWTGGYNIAKHKLPLFLEVGAEAQGAILKTKYVSGTSVSSFTHYPLSVNIPVHVAYQLSYKDFTLSPFMGPNFNVGVYDVESKQKEMYSDYGDRFTAGWNMGAGFTYKKLYVGYRGTIGFIGSSYSNFYLGLQF